MVNKITTQCGSDCTLCNNLITLLSDRRISLDEAMANRTQVAQFYTARFGLPRVNGVVLRGGEAVSEIRSAICDLRVA